MESKDIFVLQVLYSDGIKQYPFESMSSLVRSYDKALELLREQDGTYPKKVAVFLAAGWGAPLEYMMELGIPEKEKVSSSRDNSFF